MKKFNLLALAILVGAVQVALIAQVPSDQFVSGKGRFSIAVAAKPTERKDMALDFGKYRLDGEAITWRDKEQNFIELQYYYVYGPKTRPTEKDKENVINEYKKSWLDDLAKAGVLVTEAPFKFNGFQGIELRTTGSAKFLGRFFFTPSRFVAFLTTKPKAVGFEPLISLLNSFHFLTKSEYSAALISENTPPTMLQSTTATKAQSDLEENGLRGAVTEIITDNQESAKVPRERASEEYYDAHGNLTKTIYFHLGYPSLIGQWGWLEGQRVVNKNFIRYGSYEGPNEEKITELTAWGSPDGSKARKRDERYSNRYVYKYDSSGHLIEKITYQNNGSIWTREVHNYRKGEHGYSVLDEKGQLNSRWVETFDSAGTIIEERQYDFHNKLESTTIYEYKFDSIGNWTIRKSFEKSVVKGKPKLKPGSTSFRQITYFNM